MMDNGMGFHFDFKWSTIEWMNNGVGFHSDFDWSTTVERDNFRLTEIHIPQLIILMWKNERTLKIFRKSVNLHKRATMATTKTTISYIRYKHKELFDILRCHKKFIAEFYNWKFTLATLIKIIILITIHIATDMNNVANMLEMHNRIFGYVAVD